MNELFVTTTKLDYQFQWNCDCPPTTLTNDNGHDDTNLDCVGSLQDSRVSNEISGLSPYMGISFFAY